MNQQDIAQLRALMEYEANRSEPPKAFPDLPDLPAGRYTDQRFYDLEMEHIWQKSWLLAAHIDELPEPGCFRLWDNLGQPVVLVHADSGNINAFYNTCRHRGAPIVTEPEGKRPRLTCKYHGWSYSHEGELLAVRDPEDFRNLDFSCRSLIKVRCERFGNLIFVNFDDDAPTLLDWLGPIAEEWKEFQFDKCRLSGKHIFDLDCNYKIAMEANTEVYHVPSIHPKTVAPALDDRRNVNTLYPNGHGRMIAPGKKMDAPPAYETSDSNIRVIDTVGEIARTCTQSYGIFPNWVSPLTHTRLPPLLFWPNGIDKCRLETWTLLHDWGDGPKPEVGDFWTTPDGSELNVVLQEDTQFGAFIQKSMESKGFKGVPLSYQEARIYHWNQQADRMIGIDNVPPELRVEQVIGEEWIYPNDPRIEEMAEAEAAQKRDAG